ncbi:TlyA family RNA methyltransferase [Tepidimonas charontis]|uniref:16S/23S rRNA (Cytidine-2'-O)-methyltransferase TlyA n=1 Tax=Tepidimonas charontis TaxID=2267262 RepID=A0A554XEX0_9BURK|nr:TlyA family RNA methyltransferase [Tepidimonas charontis]TSE34373.1 16S/23S rRNA (cytidine-2'-O)-methyltransferase TlyA [Tepidimonas charontis]
MRADRLLVQRGLAPTRSAAQRLIERGAVRWLAPGGWCTLAKGGDELPAGCAIELSDDAELRYVSRGGLKLAGALAHTGLLVHGWRCLDVGQSTGGFTDCLLQAGAAQVVGVDVGHGQLHARLRADARVVAVERCNARTLDAPALVRAGGPAAAPPFDLIVGDLSFISQTLVWPALLPLLAPHGQMLMLVKPQFELQPGDIGKGGLVRDPAAHQRVRARVADAAQALGLRLRDYFDSPIAGGDGNREFFAWLCR